MVRSYHAAKAVTRVGETFGYRLGACASVALIRDAPAIFPRRVPEPGAPLGDFAYRGYLAGAAFVLAISVTECFAEVTLPVWHQTEARDNFLDHVNQIIDDPEYTQRNAVLALVDCLHEFREAGDQLTAGPPVTARSAPETTRPRRWWQLGAAAAAVIAVIAVVLWMIPISPFGGQANVPAPEHLTASAVLPLPDATTVVPLTQALPNTRVQLFVLAGSGAASVDAQTAPGILPRVQAPVMRINDRLVFQLWLSVKDIHAASDRLAISIGATSPTAVTDSHLMMDRNREGSAQPQLDSGDFVPVPPVAADGSPTIYQFVIDAPPDRRTVGYWCGYNAKPVQILVSTNDNAVAVATSYPLYVVRDKDC